MKNSIRFWVFSVCLLIWGPAPGFAEYSEIAPSFPGHSYTGGDGAYFDQFGGDPLRMKPDDGLLVDTSFVLAQADASREVEEEFENDEDYDDDFEDQDLNEEQVADPFEGMNRAFFAFNDKLYFWFFKPLAIGYGTIFPEPVRISIRNFFSNIEMPIRAVNCLLQGKFKAAGNEVGRFCVNTLLGVGGLGDPATEVFGMDKQLEDLGQSMGVWGLGPGFYINWPILGPSTARDTVGWVGDLFLDPIAYLLDYPILGRAAVATGEMVNEASLRIGDYEDLKAAAIDPYVALRDAYYQYRLNKIKD